MIRLLLLLLFLALGAGLGWAFLTDSGYLLLAWRQTAIEMSLFLAVLLLALAAVLGVIGLELVLGLFGLRALLDKWLSQRRYQRAQQCLSRGMTHLALGDFRRAEKLCARAAQLAPDPLPAYLAASQAAQAQQALSRAEDYLVLAETPATRLPVQLTRARLWMESGQWENAASSLKALYTHHRKEPAIAELLLQALIRLRAWSELVPLLPALAVTLDRAPVDSLVREGCQQGLQWLAQTGNRVDRLAALKRLRECWETLPVAVRRDPDVLQSYAEATLGLGFDEEAEVLVRDALGQHWHHGLIALYGRIRHPRPEQGRQQALDWLKQHPHSPALLLTLGRLSLQTRQWQDAKGYFEHSLSLHQSTETYAEFVRLLHRLNDPEAEHYLVAGLSQLVARPLPNLPLP